MVRERMKPNTPAMVKMRSKGMKAAAQARGKSATMNLHTRWSPNVERFSDVLIESGMSAVNVVAGSNV